MQELGGGGGGGSELNLSTSPTWKLCEFRPPTLGYRCRSFLFLLVFAREPRVFARVPPKLFDFAKFASGGTYRVSQNYPNMYFSTIISTALKPLKMWIPKFSEILIKRQS